MFDIQLNNELDLLIIDGDISFDETTNQDIFVILSYDKGSLKQYPTAGIGISNIIGDNDINACKRIIREELTKMGLVIEILRIDNNGIIELKAKYK